MAVKEENKHFEPQTAEKNKNIEPEQNLSGSQYKQTITGRVLLHGAFEGRYKVSRTR